MPDIAATPSGKKPHLMLIDGYGFVFRAYHSLPPLTRPDGTPVGAVYGFTNMLIKLLDSSTVDYIAVVFDSGRKSFRNDLYADYKANRPEAPADLIPQFPLVRDVTSALNLATLELEGYEADDLIATYARQAVAQQMDVTIVSSDKDLMQLIGDSIRMYDPMKSRAIGVKEVEEKFGVTPDKVLDVLALMGDSSDNIPGVPGIGPKTAAELIHSFGDLDGILANTTQIKQQKRRETLETNAGQARLSRELARLCENTPMPMPLEACKLKAIDASHLMTFLQQQGFKSLATKMGQKYGATAMELPLAAPSATTAPKAIIDHQTIETLDTLQAWLKTCESLGTLSCYYTPTSLTLGLPNGSARYIPLADETVIATPMGDLFAAPQTAPAAGITLTQLRPLLEPVYANPAILKIGYDMKYMLRHLEMPITPVDDVMMMSYIIGAGKYDHSIAALWERYGQQSLPTLKEKTATPEELRALAFLVIQELPTIHASLKQALAQDKMTTLYERMERPLITVLANMERAGIKVDAARLKALSSDFEKRLAVLEHDIHQLAGESFNIGSPKQLGVILFDKLNLDPSAKTSKTGAYSTGADILEDLAAKGHILPEKVLAWRQLSKLKSTYTDALQQQMNPKTGRVHSTFAMAATSTGRLSSIDPNLQNIPIRTEEGNKIRSAFITEQGCKLLSADYSQIELRLLAHVADIPTLRDAFRANQDIHAITASEIFGIPLAEMTPVIRRQAKAINFGIIYGISAFGLARQLGIGRSEAGQYIDMYFKRYPGIREYMERTKAFAHEHGYVETLFGRRCYLNDINSSNGALKSFSERAAINAPLQGTAADIIKRAMVRLPDALAQQGLKARMVLQVHDELLIEAPEAEAEKTAAIVKATMEHVAQLQVPLVVEVGIGDNWQAIH